MLEVMSCKQCHRKVKAKLTKGFAHIKCECGCSYELEATSLKIYMILPFVAVFGAILLRRYIFPAEDIVGMFVFILVIAYLIYVLLCLLFIKIKWFQYSKRVGG